MYFKLKVFKTYVRDEHSCEFIELIIKIHFNNDVEPSSLNFFQLVSKVASSNKLSPSSYFINYMFFLPTEV